jgi:cyclohexyl-isocyanide hydratase
VKEQNMNRRELTLAFGAASLMFPQSLVVAAPFEQVTRAAATASAVQIAMLIHPEMVLLDLVGPHTVFSLTTADVPLVWRTRDAVMTSTGLPIVPTADFSECPEDLDVLFVPGGLKGSIALMNDDAVLDFLIDRARRAKYVTSVCTGSLVLAAAGLLKGYRATSHWYVRDLLPQMGAIADHGRVVIDRNRVTGGGVTAGLDFGLTLAALLRSADDACRIELVLGYAPAPPFHAGTPEEAGEALTREVLAGRAPMLASAREAAARAAKRLLQ